MRDHLSGLSAFLAIAKHLSFQRAAVERGVTRSALSHALRGLETELGVRLLHRTTRNVSLTDAGSRLLARLGPVFHDIGRALDEVNRFRDKPFGTIRLTVPRAVGTVLMGPMLARLTEENPDLEVEVSSNDRLVDIVAEGFDAGIRFGERLQKDTIAVRIDLPLSFAVVASPAYFAKHPAPRDLAELANHLCIRYRFPSGVDFPWEFVDQGVAKQVDVRGPVVLDDQALMVQAALAGAGLAFVFKENIVHELQERRLVQCLADYCPSFRELFLYYPHREFVPAGLRALIALLKRPSPTGTRVRSKRPREPKRSSR